MRIAGSVADCANSHPLALDGGHGYQRRSRLLMPRTPTRPNEFTLLFIHRPDAAPLA